MRKKLINIKIKVCGVGRGRKWKIQDKIWIALILKVFWVLIFFYFYIRAPFDKFDLRGVSIDSMYLGGGESFFSGLFC